MKISTLIVLLFISVILLVGCTSNSQNASKPLYIKINLNKVDFTLINGIANVERKPFTGTVYLIYPDSVDTTEIRNYSNGIENGEWRKYYKGGKLREKRSFTNGQKTGKYLVWWENGKLQQTYNFENDEYEGTCREWGENGLLIKEMNYRKGYEAGTQKAWWNNGKIKSNYIIEKGRRYGLLGTKNCINVSDSIFK